MNKQGTAKQAVTKRKYLHSGTKYPINGSTNNPATQNKNEPTPIFARCFCVVNSERRTKLVAFRKPKLNNTENEWLRIFKLKMSFAVTILFT